jgi:hypothetical protein
VSFSPGTHVLTEPYKVPSNTYLDLTGVTLKYPDGFDGLATGGEFGLLDIENVNNVEIVGGTFDGGLSTRIGWSQHSHAIRVRSATNVKIRNGKFHNLAGDGVFVSAFNPTDPHSRGSQEVRIQGNEFHGTNQNRQGVSICHATSVQVEGNLFVAMARPDMPGAIDLEPDYGHQQVDHIFIYQNIIRGGQQKPLGGIVVYNRLAAAPMNNITILENSITGPFSHGIYLEGHSAVEERDIRIASNTLRDVDTPITVINVTADVAGNDDDDRDRKCRQNDPKKRRRCKRRQR